ncbi:MAG: hypothetical protein Kow0099_21850 [Candidatus Abyssubacteria bacterium]
MPKKYRIHGQLMPPRFVPVPKYSMIEKEGCLGCLECAKRDCVYDVYKNRRFDPARMVDSIDYLCKNCLRCIQGCKNQILSKMRNPDFEALGDEHWKPDQIASLWEQATTGKIPVSGAGYRGPFSGPNFDSMWTDMSEIVRPTRDGIHGREYINTSVDIGRKPTRLRFINGRLDSDIPPQVEIPIPILFDTPPFGVMNEQVRAGFVQAAEMVGSMAIVPEHELDWKLMARIDHIVPLIGANADLGDDRIRDMVVRAKLVELEDSPDVTKRMGAVKDINRNAVVAVRMPTSERACARVEELAREGAEAVHLAADWQGNEPGAPKPRFLKDVLREVHLNLIENSLRDEVTLIASGGIAMAEHVAKSIICGADLVGVDQALGVALECRVCKRCARGLSCPASIGSADPDWASARIRNLMCSWHSQLIEVLGAMGLREVRRLRGEVGRALFYEDLEKEAFGDVKIAPETYRAR